MTQDLNKRISSIQYNLLNLPQNITYSTGSTIAYTYDASGKKLHVAYGSPNSTTDYCGNMIYENGTLTKILVDGGYITFSGTAPVYHYYLKDHQGNNRVVMSSSGTVEQVNHYFPYGYLFGESTNSGTQKYKYNDKEFDMTHGLHWYDYGARHYDPCIMRFTTMDPMCEKYYNLSPYAYCGNNPVNAVDPLGMDWYEDKDGTYQYSPKVHSQKDLDKGQTYLWKAKNFSKQGIDYRSDGSILYNNETAAYNRIWDQADRHYRQFNKGGREVGGFILSNGKVLVLPDYKNDATSSQISDYGYKLNKDGTLSHGEESFEVLANIHTHQERTTDPRPSESDAIISEIMGIRPVLTIGHNGNIYGILGNKNNKTFPFVLPSPLGSRNYLLKGGKTRLSMYVKYNNWKLK